MVSEGVAGEGDPLGFIGEFAGDDCSTVGELIFSDGGVMIVGVDGLEDIVGFDEGVVGPEGDDGV